MPDNFTAEPDVVLIGAGIMSSTLGVFLKELEPSLTIAMFETLEDCGLESSEAWNNAGTGHAANCEMNYTPERPDGSVDISKALEVNVEFDLSRQFWSYLVQKGAIADPRSFIHPVPHMSFVHGGNVSFLRKRFKAMSAHHCYYGMEYTEDRQKIAEWAPLVMEGRPTTSPLRRRGSSPAPTSTMARSPIIWSLISSASRAARCITGTVSPTSSARSDGRWRVEVHDLESGEKRSVTTKFVFIGAGGGALPLLQKSGIPEGHGYGGFPVSGIWLRCDDPEINKRHHAKVYGKAAVGSPPMSVPHLDTRVIGGQHSLLFGPYAGFSSKFLKHGSLLDLFESVRPANIEPLLSVARDNFDLTEYLIGQVLQSESHRLAALDEYFPNAKPEDWKLQVAGQRVQIYQARRQARRLWSSEPSSSARRIVRSLRSWAPRRALPPRLHRDQRAGEVLPRRADGQRVAAEAEGDHSILRRVADRGCRTPPARSRGYGASSQDREH